MILKLVWCDELGMFIIMIMVCKTASIGALVIRGVRPRLNEVIQGFAAN